MRFISIFILSLVLIVGCTTEEKQHFDLIVQNGNIIDLETGNISKKDVFISDGRIKQITPPDSLKAYYVKENIDAAGKYIVPGFWDNHTHFRGGDSLINANKNFLNLFIANGITTVRDAGGDLTTSVLAWKQQIMEGTLVGPIIFTSGPKIDGKGATWAGSLEVENEADVQKALDSLEQIPTDFVKLYDSRISGDLYLKTIIEAEQRKMITSGHMPFTVTLDETVDAGIDAIEHLYYVMKGCASNEKEITRKLQNNEINFWDAMPLLLSNYQDSTAQKTFSYLKENDVFVVPTLHIGKILSYLDEMEHQDDEYLKYMSDGIIKTYEGRINRAKNNTEKAVADRKALDVFFGKLSKSLNDAGVQLLAGSDSGAYNSYTYPGISLHKELEQMVANGISPLDALKASAYNGAKFLKQENDYGLISVNKKADLVILEGNPLEDIQNTQKIEMVIQGGLIHTKKDLQTLLMASKQH